ncbi:MAG: xanthine dehydrogenase accessory protein XdhC [Burkholderiales bacterium]|nr:xanthine dehydrogenase accessory protein XdhC [Burkholderiales bacterium]
MRNLSGGSTDTLACFRQGTFSARVNQRHTVHQNCRTPRRHQQTGSTFVNDLTALVAQLALGPAVLVTVVRVEGSGPREPGAWMAVFAHQQVGTVGGGQLEWQLQAHARAVLAGAALQTPQRHALGPSLGQCCGGVVHLTLELVTLADAPALAQRLGGRGKPLALFGGGHVGKALVQALTPLPFELVWVDSRDGIFPADVPPQVTCEHSDPVHLAVNDLAAGSAVLVMSFSHAEDLDVVAQCLTRQRQRGDLGWVGLIGSKTKWASFRHRLVARGFTEVECDQVTCPIGLPGIAGKQPAVIAAAVAAQMLQVCGC